MAATFRASSCSSASARPGKLTRKLATVALALMLGGACPIEPLWQTGIVRGDVVFGSSTVTGAGASGFSGYRTSTPVGVSTTTPTPSLITISDTWTANDSSSVTYRSSAVGGLDPASTPANATFSGRLSLQDDPGGPPPAGQNVTFSYSEPYFDLVLDTQSLVTATGTITNANSAIGNQVTISALSIYDTAWNFLEGSGFAPTSAATFTQNYQTTLNPGTYRFATFANSRTDPTWQGNTVTMDWSFTVTAVPEPSSMALLGLGAAGVVAWRARRKAAQAERSQAQA